MHGHCWKICSSRAASTPASVADTQSYNQLRETLGRLLFLPFSPLLTHKVPLCKSTTHLSEIIMAGKLTAAQGTGILLVTANVGSLFEDVSLLHWWTLLASALPSHQCCLFHLLFSTLSAPVFTLSNAKTTSQPVTTRVCVKSLSPVPTHINTLACHNNTDPC